MGIEEKLADKQGTLLAGIEKAIKLGDTRTVIALSSKLKEIEMMRSQIEQINKTLSNYSSNNSDELQKVALRPVDARETTSGEDYQNLLVKVKGNDHQEARKRAAMARKTFLLGLKDKGIALQTHSGKRLYKDNAGNIICIDYASEKHKNKWWFGPPSADYFALVLLCELQTGGIDSLVFKDSDISKIRDLVIDPERNRYVMNILKANGEYYLKPSGRDPINISHYLNNYANLAVFLR